MAELTLNTEGDHRWFRPGTSVSGEAAWRLETAADAIEVRLFWHTSGAGARDVGVVDSLRIHRPGPRGQARFRLQIPDGPYSFTGQLITLRWAVELVVVPSGENDRRDLVVGPRPVEIRLAAVPKRPRVGAPR